MNRLIIAITLALGAMPPAVAQEQPPVSAGEGVDPEALKLVTDCDARKFETVVEREVNGEKKSSKVKLCGKPGQTDAQWVATLEDAAAKIEANPKLSKSAKDQLAAALKAEISKVEAAIAVPPAVVVAEEQPAPGRNRSAAPSVPASSVAKVSKPQLVIRCLQPGEDGAGTSCSLLDRETRLSILAENEVTGGTSLRFLRRGDEQSQLALGPMRQGQFRRVKLPPQLCAGVFSSKIEIHVMNGGQVIETLGPYSLLC